MVSKISEVFTLREIAKNLKMNVSLVHRATKPLIQNKILIQNKFKNISLNFKENQELLAYAESLRKEDFLKTHKDLYFFGKDVISQIKEESFSLILFGSILEINNPRDIDLLLIVDKEEKIDFHEKFLENIAQNYDLHLDTKVICFENVYEMLLSREENNLMNQILNKHLILYGGELFYRLISKGIK